MTAPVQLCGNKYIDCRLVPPWRPSHQTFSRSSEVSDLIQIFEDTSGKTYRKKLWASLYGVPIETVGDVLNEFHLQFNLTDADLLITMSYLHSYPESAAQFAFNNCFGSTSEVHLSKL